MQLSRGRRLGPYEIVAPIGAGGMGEVYSATDTRLGRDVAIKVLPAHLSSNAALRQRFEREAKVVSGLNHPNICTLHDVGADGDLGFLVMELCDGQTLADRLAKGPVPLDQALRYGIQIADALDRAHQSGVVHRDLKPGNVMLTRSGAKLLDFGLAKPAPLAAGPEAATEAKPLTEEGAIVGTFQYMAPEQIEGQEVDHRSDIFAFGAILYEMITGHRAFEGATKASLIASILDREPRPLSAVQPLAPVALERVIQACLAKNREERWQSARDLRLQLEWIREGVSPSDSKAAPRQTSRLAWMLAAILPVAAAVATWYAAERFRLPDRRIVAKIAPPPGHSFVSTGDAGGPVTLSPDGRHAVFVAAKDRDVRLWLTSVETGVTKPLPGTEQATFPFWSPDSRSIAFFIPGKLMVTDIDGSSPRMLADAADGRGGAWGPEGQIVFTPFTQTGFLTVSAAGGPVRQILTPEAPFTTYRWPAFLPDGKHFLYLAANHASPAAGETAIFIASLDGKKTRRLLSTQGSALVFGDYILYLRENRLLAHRFDGTDLVGEPQLVWEGVAHDYGTWRSIFSVSGTGLLAYHATSRTNAPRVVWLDANGKETAQIDPGGVARDVAVSPDGTRAAISTGDPKSVVHIHDFESGARTRLFLVPESVAFPVWTPDSASVVVAAVGGANFRLLVKAADGSTNERVLLNAPVPLRPTDVSPDGRFVLFHSREGDADVMAVPVAGGKTFPVAGGSGYQAVGRFSPDGRWVTFDSTDESGRALYMTPFPPTGAKLQISNEPAYGSWWSADGKEIFYLAGDGVKSVRISTAGGVVRLSAASFRFPLNVNTNRQSASMTKDGRFLAVITEQNDSSAATLVTNFHQRLE